jgi:hypothetical protein
MTTHAKEPGATPRTDARRICVEVHGYSEFKEGWFVTAGFARQLERELTALRATAEQLARALVKVHPFLMGEIGRLSLNESAKNGLQSAAREASEALDEARAAKLVVAPANAMNLCTHEQTTK